MTPRGDGFDGLKPAALLTIRCREREDMMHTNHTKCVQIHLERMEHRMHILKQTAPKSAWHNRHVEKNNSHRYPELVGRRDQ